MSDDNPLMKKLKGFYQLAILRPEEENDQGRQNEARTAAFLLIKTARENGVKIKFHVPPAEAKKPATETKNGEQKGGVDFSTNPFDNMSDLFNDMARQVEERDRRRQEERKRNEARDEANRRAKEREAAQRSRDRDSQRGPSFWDTNDRGPGIPVPDPFVPPNSRPTPGCVDYSKGAGPKTRPPQIITQMEGTCRKCGERVPVGRRVWWVRNVGISHEECGWEKLVEAATG